MIDKNLISSNNFSLYKFTILNFIEKFLAYLSPLLVIQLLNDRVLYNEIELIYSISLIFNVIFDFGIRGYFTYSLRKIKDKKKYAKQILQLFNLLFLLISILFLISIISIYTLDNFSKLTIYILIYFRFAYLFITNFYKVYFRMISNPFFIFFFTITVNIMVFIIIIYGVLIKDSNIDLLMFFLPIIGFSLLYLLYLFVYIKVEFNIYKLVKFIINSGKFYWPIILTTIISLFLGNFIKIFSYYELSSYDMTKSSFFLRILMIIQLTHASFAAYYLKKNFLENTKKIDKKILFMYLRNITIVMVCVFMIAPIYIAHLNLNLELDVVFIFMGFYVYLWCVGSYLEQFLTKYNYNIYILKYYSISVILYLSVLFFMNSLNLITISLAMFISSLFYFIFITIKLFKLKILT